MDALARHQPRKRRRGLWPAMASARAGVRTRRVAARGDAERCKPRPDTASRRVPRPAEPVLRCRRAGAVACGRARRPGLRGLLSGLAQRLRLPRHLCRSRRGRSRQRGVHGFLHRHRLAQPCERRPAPDRRLHRRARQGDHRQRRGATGQTGHGTAGRRRHRPEPLSLDLRSDGRHPDPLPLWRPARRARLGHDRCGSRWRSQISEMLSPAASRRSDGAGRGRQFGVRRDGRARQARVEHLGAGRRGRQRECHRRSRDPAGDRAECGVPDRRAAARPASRARQQHLAGRARTGAAPVGLRRGARRRRVDRAGQGNRPGQNRSAAV